MEKRVTERFLRGDLPVGAISWIVLMGAWIDARGARNVSIVLRATNPSAAACLVIHEVVVVKSQAGNCCVVLAVGGCCEPESKLLGRSWQYARRHARTWTRPRKATTRWPTLGKTSAVTMRAHDADVFRCISPSITVHITQPGACPPILHTDYYTHYYKNACSECVHVMTIVIPI